jgi:hypothetical protein
MNEESRQHKRIEKRVTIQFCVADVSPQKWDMSFVDNISVGGVKFIASSDLKLNEHKIRLQIKIPELSPRFLKLEAMVLSATPRLNGKTSDIRAKFTNLTQEDKEDLAVLEKIIHLQVSRNAVKADEKKA